MPLNLTESRVRAALIADIHTTLHLDLTSTEHFLVEATLRFTCRQPGADTFVELAGGSDVLLDGLPAPYDGERITLTGAAAENEIRISARMPYVSDGDGMTVTVDPADGERYVCAFTAMDIAHRVIPCFDQPDLKTTFTVSVTGPEHWTVLANGPMVSRLVAGAPHTSTTQGVAGAPHTSTSENETVRWSFGTTPPISSYLFFVGAGPWVSETWDEPYAAAPGGTVPFGWHARASQAPALRRDAAELRRITSNCFQHYTTVFDAPYAFADYQQVFTPGLNWGAMEFPGCVAFRDQYLVDGTPTALEREWLSSTIAHEMAHMWFGDLVTMKWWEDSWLNESFADFMGYDVAAIAAGYDDAWTSAALTRKPAGYRADRRRSTHPVAEDAERMVDADTAFANFDMITYAKGNAVLRQLGFWLGDDFMAGVNRHLNGHAFGNATLADFLDALDASTDRDVRDWAERWLRTTGVDTIEVTRDGDVPVLVRHGSRPHRLSVGLFDDAMRQTGSLVVDLGDEPVRLDDAAGLVVVPNAGDETFAEIRLDDASWRAVAAGLASVEVPLTRAVLWWQVLDRVESGALSLAEFGAVLRDHLAPERHPVILEAVLSGATRIARLYGDPATAPGLMDQIVAVAESALESGVADLVPAASQALAGATSDADRLRDWLTDPSVEQSVRWAIVQRLAALGHADQIEAEEARDASVSGHLAALTARAAIATPEAKATAWESLMGGSLANHEFSAVAAGFWGWDQADLVQPYLERYVAEALTLGRRSGQAMGQIIGRSVPNLALPRALRQEFRDRLAQALANEEIPTVLARQWNDALDDIDRALAAEN